MPTPSAEPKPLITPEDLPEELTDEEVSKLSESLKSCHKVVDKYRAALLNTPGREESPPSKQD